MADYIYTNDGSLYNTDELKHYGVKGMKWGVRRSIKQLHEANSSGSKGGHNNAVAKLHTHKDKATSKLNKLDAKYKKLEKIRTKQINESDIKASKLETKAAKLRAKQYSRFTSKSKAETLDFKATKLEVQAHKLKAKSELTKAKMAKNRQLASLFKQGIDDIDHELITKAQDFLYMKKDQYGMSVPYTLADD